jgi:DNA-binding MarR family transcriptional regulator
MTDNNLLMPWVCYVSRLSTRFVGGELSGIGFGTGHFFLLSELYKEDGLSQDELSRRIGVDKANTSRSVAKLEKYGLIHRKTDPENYKVRKVYLTPKAHEFRKQFRKIQEDWNNYLLRGFSEKEINGLLASMKKIAVNAESRIYDSKTDTSGEKSEEPE